MRTIKFRVWDNILKYYLKQKSTLLIDITDGAVYDSVKDDYIADCIVEQFTGLHDKNGKEIYEGDVVKTNLGNMIVEYCSVFGKYNYKYNTNTLDAGCHFVEVIGNIHENQELTN